MAAAIYFVPSANQLMADVLLKTLSYFWIYVKFCLILCQKDMQNLDESMQIFFVNQ